MHSGIFESGMPLCIHVKYGVLGQSILLIYSYKKVTLFFCDNLGKCGPDLHPVCPARTSAAGNSHPGYTEYYYIVILVAVL